MDLGDTLPFRAQVFDKPVEEGGVLTDASAAVLTVALPDGTTVTPSVANPATGEYAADYITTGSSPEGRYVGKWLFTFVGGATTSYVESFEVGSSLVTVDEAVAHLRASGIITSEADLDHLQWLCMVASDAVESDLRRMLLKRTVTVTKDGGLPLVSLTPPVVSVDSVTVSGSAVTDFVVNKESGLLYRDSTGCQRWTHGVQNITVTYEAGHVNPPRVARKVALNVVQGMWQVSQQASHPLVDEFAEESVGAAVAALTPIEQNAYENLRMPA